MQDEDKIEIKGEADEQETIIDLDAPAVEPVKEEIEVEEVQETAPTEKTETKKEELEEYSEGVQKRISKLTRRMREAERQKEEAITFARVQKEESDKLRNRFKNLDQNYTQEFEKRVTSNTEAAKIRLAAAINSGDVEAQVEAQAEIARLAMDESRLNNIKRTQEIRTSAPVEPTTQQAQPNTPARPDPKADAWASKNAWFGSDNAMTYTAFDIHKKLVEDEGFDANSDDYYAEVDRRIRLEFPHKFGTVDSNTSEVVQNVASAKRPAAKGRRKTVRLTPSQVAISKRLGVPLEEYAKQLAAKEV
jgi:hypothetical protein|tara:strand:+ start:332 stop:1246 length:915 start_codon:yes stop_codon:yes gene_type:complete